MTDHPLARTQRAKVSKSLKPVAFSCFFKDGTSERSRLFVSARTAAHRDMKKNHEVIE